jgi:ribonuclease P protein component
VVFLNRRRYMKKRNILKNSRDFTKIIKSKTPYKSKNYIIYLDRTEEESYHFGISVSKKIGNAVVRNRIKRQIKSILDKKDYKKGFNCIIIVRKSLLNLDFNEMRESLFEQIHKLKIEKERSE